MRLNGGIVLVSMLNILARYELDPAVAFGSRRRVSGVAAGVSPRVASAERSSEERPDRCGGRSLESGPRQGRGQGHRGQEGVGTAAL